MRNLYMIVVGIVFIAVVICIGAAAWEFYHEAICPLTDALQKIHQPIQG